MKQKHLYVKPRGYGAYTPKKLINVLNSCATKLGWARPLPYYSLFERIAQAFDVLTYKADALYWKEIDE